MVWNFFIGLGASLFTVYVLQRLIPAYGKKINLSNFIFDGGIFSTGIGISGYCSLNQIEDDLRPLRKTWITEHNKDYLKTMQFMQKNYQISILEQIREYVKEEKRSSWKLKYDALIN